MKQIIETGKDRVQQICDLLKKDTIEPAQEEADKITQEAKAAAEEILAKARAEAEEILAGARKDIENERNVFASSLNLAAKQAIASLKQEIDEKVFNRELNEMLKDHGSSKEVVSKLIEAICSGIQKDGLDASLSVLIPKSLPAQEVNQVLAKEILSKLEKESVSLGEFASGAQVKLKEKHMIIDLSDDALRQLLATYIREDFRNLIFQAS